MSIWPLGTGALVHAYLREPSWDEEPTDVLVWIDRLNSCRLGVAVLGAGVFWISTAVAGMTPAPLDELAQEPARVEIGRLRAAVETRRLDVPDTRLYFDVSASRVSVLTQDGGGCGEPPTVRWNNRGGSGRATRVGFQVGVYGTDGSREAHVTGAGVRLGDSLGLRLTAEGVGWLLLCLALLATFGFGFLVWFPVALIRDPANTEVSSLSSLPFKDKLKAFMGLSLQIGLVSYGLLLAIIVLMRLG